MLVFAETPLSSHALMDRSIINSKNMLASTRRPRVISVPTYLLRRKTRRYVNIRLRTNLARERLTLLPTHVHHLGIPDVFRSWPLPLVLSALRLAAAASVFPSIPACGGRVSNVRLLAAHPPPRTPYLPPKFELGLLQLADLPPRSTRRVIHRM